MAVGIEVGYLKTYIKKTTKLEGSRRYIWEVCGKIMGEDQNTFHELLQEFIKLLLRSKQFRFKKGVRISNNVNCFTRKERKEGTVHKWTDRNHKLISINAENAFDKFQYPTNIK